MQKVKSMFLIMACFCPAIGFIVYQHISQSMGALVLVVQCFMVAVPAKMLHDSATNHVSCLRRTMLGMSIFGTGIMIILFGLLAFRPETAGLHASDRDITLMKPYVPFLIMANLALCGVGVLLIKDAMNKGWRNED